MRQTFQPGEIILIDDGSTDGTGSMAHSYIDAGLKYIRQDNLGEGAARNRGICEAAGDWIAFLDADDLWVEDKLRLQVEFVQSHPEVGLVSGNKLWWDMEKDSYLLVRYGQIPARNLYKELIVRNVVGDPSITLIRRNLFDKAGLFRTDLRIGVDWEMWLRIARHTSIGFIDAPLIIYRWHQGNVSHRYTAQRIRTEEVISYQAINAYKHPLVRAELYLRVKSRSQVELTLDVMAKSKSKTERLKHALRAFLLFPFEDTGEKARLLLRSLLGDQIYLALKSKFQSVGNSIDNQSG